MEKNDIIDEEIFKKWKEAFGSEEEFDKRLHTENFHFNQQTPSAWLSITKNKRHILNTLKNMEHGDFA